MFKHSRSMGVVMSVLFLIQPVHGAYEWINNLTQQKWFLPTVATAFVLSNLASFLGGKYYMCTKIESLAKLFQRIDLHLPSTWQDNEESYLKAGLIIPFKNKDETSGLKMVPKILNTPLMVFDERGNQVKMVKK